MGHMYLDCRTCFKMGKCSPNSGNSSRKSLRAVSTDCFCHSATQILQKWWPVNGLVELDSMRALITTTINFMVARTIKANHASLRRSDLPSLLLTSALSTGLIVATCSLTDRLIIPTNTFLSCDNARLLACRAQDISVQPAG